MDRSRGQADGRPCEVSVLVVDDEPGLADLYAHWLADDYQVTTAYGGEAALEALSSTPDVVLLDRRMYDLSGDEVLAEVGRRSIDCAVAMVTAVEPDFDVLEMGFDEYLVKPVSRQRLQDLVESLLALRTYDEHVGELFRLYAKRSAIEARKSPEELARNEAYQSLEERIRTVEASADAAMVESVDRDPPGLFRGLATSSWGQVP